MQRGPNQSETRHNDCRLQAHSRRLFLPGNLEVHCVAAGGTPRGTQVGLYLRFHDICSLSNGIARHHWLLCQINYDINQDKSDIGHDGIIFIILVLPAISFSDGLLRSDKFHTLDPLDHLVAQLVLGAKPQGGSMEIR